MPEDYLPVVKRSLPLLALLSALALGASIVRAVAQLQLMSSVGASLSVRTLVLLEAGNWLGWTAWAAILVVIATRLEARARLDALAVSGVIALALAPMVAVPMISSPWHMMVTGSGTIHESARHIMGHNLPTNLLLGVAMAGIVYGSLVRERTKRLERTAADLRAQLAESQLATLRAQLNPHFLFNALNSVAVLARRGEVASVAQVVERLSGLLRHSLDAASAQVVPLRVELEALRHYLDIEQVRHGARLVVRWAIAPGLDDRVVPSFILQPLVENAVQHGFSDPARALTVEVSVLESAGRLELRVADDGEGLSMAERERPAEGIGLGHTRARLAGLYGDAASLTIVPGEGARGARVTIALPVAPRTMGAP